MIGIVEMLIMYMTKLRRFPYVCQTERKNLLGIRIIDQFYVDAHGYPFSDSEDTAKPQFRTSNSTATSQLKKQKTSQV